jgi:CRP-like cAMP-binding protein
MPEQFLRAHTAPRENTEPMPSRALNRAFAAALAERIDLRTLPSVAGTPGQLVLDGNEPLHRLPLIEAGLLEAVVMLGDDGHRVVPVWFAPGELAMLSSLFSTERPQADLVWRAEGRLRWVPKRELEAAVQAHPGLGMALLRFMAQRLREVQSRERVWLERSVHERVRAVLGRALGAGDTDGPVWITATHEQLAEHCDVSRSKVSLALKVLERGGVLRLHRGAVEILSPAALRGPGA